jgi:hypothetical protein
VLVSIITPSYNQAAYLEDTLHSVLAQDYAPLEYIVIDGGSSDGSQEIIQRYANRLTYWVSEPDSGQADAINKGFRRARGEIIAWLNSDDLYLPGAIQHAVQALQSEPAAGMVFGDAITINPQGTPLKRLAFGDWGLAELLRFRIICQPAVFMRRAVFEQAGGLDPSCHFMLDHHLWIRMAGLAPIRYIGGDHTLPLAAARHHPQAKNVSLASQFAAETQRLLAWIEALPETTNPPAGLSADRSEGAQIRGGAYRLIARYLLDGGQPKESLQAYFTALRAWPSYTLKHWHRMLYAAALLLGLKPISEPGDTSPGDFLSQLAANYARRAAARQTLALQTDLKQRLVLSDSPDLTGWPGLRLS